MKKTSTHHETSPILSMGAPGALPTLALAITLFIWLQPADSTVVKAGSPAAVPRRSLTPKWRSADPQTHPDAGSVASVDTRSFYRSPEQSPRNQSFHYHGNAETYMLVGEAMGKAMVEMQR